MHRSMQSQEWMTDFYISSLWLILIFYSDNVRVSTELVGARSIFNLAGAVAVAGAVAGQIKISVIAGWHSQGSLSLGHYL